VFASEKITVPVRAKKAGRRQSGESGPGFLKAEVALLAEPSEDADVVARVGSPGTLPLKAQFQEFYQVDLGAGRFAFVRKKDLEKGRKGPAAKLVHSISRAAPRLNVVAKSLATRDKSVSIDVLATDSTGGVQDVFVFVGNDKVFYMPNPSPKGSEMKFTFDAPLRPGINVITVVARENQDISTRHRVVVRKDGPNGEILPTPKDDLFGEDWEFGQD
jgi:carboxyl-terminal processing protease